MLIWLAGDGAAAERPLRGMQQGENWHIVLHTPKAPLRAGELLSVSEAEGGIVHGTWQLRDAPLSSRLRRDTFPVNGDSFKACHHAQVKATAFAIYSFYIPLFVNF